MMGALLLLIDTVYTVRGKKVLVGCIVISSIFVNARAPPSAEFRRLRSRKEVRRRPDPQSVSCFLSSIFNLDSNRPVHPGPLVSYLIQTASPWCKRECASERRAGELSRWRRKIFHLSTIGLASTKSRSITTREQSQTLLHSLSTLQQSLVSRPTREEEGSTTNAPSHLIHSSPRRRRRRLRLRPSPSLDSHLD